MQTVTLNAWDWVTILVFLAGSVSIGLYFTGRGGRDMVSYFVSNRSLPWYIAGVSIIATNFASDTPLWVSSLVRQYGIQTVWQFWAPLIGGALCAVLFARLWRRMGVITDIEFLELRYQGKSAAILRFWLGASGAVIICPLIISWVAKAMATIAQEVMGIPSQYQIYTTAAVLAIGLLTCVFSGLYGVVYTDLIQFFAAWIGTLSLAILAVNRVGGVSAMLEQLTNLQGWAGKNLDILPQIGPQAEGKLSIWNAVLFFGLWWVGFSVGGQHTTQRLLACRDSRHASYAHMLYIFIYFAVLAWPWILVALCSMILIPDLGTGVSHDSAYPRMIVQILPTGLRGLLVAALIAAFISTINTIFNWGSSYLVNDVYKRFLVPKAPDRHYVLIGRIATAGLALLGGYFSLQAKNIQELLNVFYAVYGSMMFLNFLRWFWPRLNAAGELAASVAGWLIAAWLIFGKLNDIAVRILHLPEGVLFNRDHDYLGARVLLLLLCSTITGIVVSLITKPVDDDRLALFVQKARPLKIFWKRIITQYGIEYKQMETTSRTLVSWVVLVISVLSLLIGIGRFITGSRSVAWGCMLVFVLTLLWSIVRVRGDFEREKQVLRQAGGGSFCIRDDFRIFHAVKAISDSSPANRAG